MLTKCSTFMQDSEVAALVPDTILLYDDSVGNVTNAPSVKPVARQFLYQPAYRGFMHVHGFLRVANTFLAPSTGGSIKHTGWMRLSGVIATEKPPFSNMMELYTLPTRMVFDVHLFGTPLDNTDMLTVIG